MDISPYRLTIIGAIVVLVLSVAVVTVIGGPSQAAQYLGLVGTIAVPGLLALFRLEQTAKQTQASHAQNEALHITNLAAVQETNTKIDALAEALKEKDQT